MNRDLNLFPTKTLNLTLCDKQAQGDLPSTFFGLVHKLGRNHQFTQDCYIALDFHKRD